MKTAILLLGACGLLLGCSQKDKQSSSEPEAKPTESMPAPAEKPAEQPAAKPAAAEATIVAVAVGDARLSTLVTALQKAGLVETLEGEGPFTVFAPTNAAFAKLPEDQLQAVLADKARLTAILKHHVVKGRVGSGDLAGLTDVMMLDGTKLPLDTSEGVMIGAARVEQADIQASNGVIHVIDTVLIPE